MTEYLGSAPIVATHSLEEAREAVSRIYLRHNLSSREGALNMRFNATSDDHLTLGYLTYQAEAELAMPPTEDCYIVNLTIAGATRGSRGDGVRERTAGNERGLVLPPQQSHRVQWSADAEQLHLQISRARLESHLADLLGKPVTTVIEFDFAVDLTSAQGRGLLRSVCFLATELATFVEILQAVMTEHPPSLGGSAALVAVDRVLQRALAKEPAGRFATAALMAAELRKISEFPRDEASPQLKRVKRVAVLPFRLLRPDPEVDFLRLGLADAIGTSLARQENVVVRSALALPAGVAENNDVQRAGAELDADTVLTGTVLHSGGRVRVSAQLIEVGTGHAKWAEQIDGTLDDLFALQDSIVSTMVASLVAKKRARDSAEVPRSEVAYKLYLQANQLAGHASTWVAARELYRESTAADERFAPAWAGLGRLERVLAKYQVDGANVDHGYALAENALRRALELSPELPQAHFYYAQLEADTGRTEEALSRLLRRLQIRQTEPEIYAGLVQVCRYCDLLDASVAAHESATALDPGIRTSIGLTRLARFEYDLALQSAVRETDDGIRTFILLAMGRREEAVRLARRPAAPISRSDNTEPMRDAIRFYLEDRPEEALTSLHAASGVDPTNDSVWPNFPDGEDSVGIAQMYADSGAMT